MIFNRGAVCAGDTIMWHLTHAQKARTVVRITMDTLPRVLGVRWVVRHAATPPVGRTESRLEQIVAWKGKVLLLRQNLTSDQLLCVHSNVRISVDFRVCRLVMMLSIREQTSNIIELSRALLCKSDDFRLRR